MKSWRIVAVLLVCLILVSLTACGDKATEGQQQTVEVTRGDLAVTVTADGNISLPWHRKLTFGLSGTVTQVNVEQGDRVTEGQVLAALDTTTIEQAVKTREQLVKTGEQAVKTGEQAVKTGKLAVKTAEIDLEVATDNFRKITYPYTYQTWVFDVPTSLVAIGDAQRQLKEAQELLEIGLTSEQYWEIKKQLEQAQDNLIEAESVLARGHGTDVFGMGTVAIKDYWTLRAAQLQMEKVQLALDAAKINLDAAKIDLDKAKINLDKAKIDLDTAKNELEKAMILVPFDGIIAAVNVKQGDKLSSMDYATKIIIELIDPSRMELSAEVDEIDIPGVELGQRAIISLDALPDTQLEGEVIEISPISTVESGIVLYSVTIGFDVPEGFGLKSGMSATADIVIDERSDVLLVPSRAVKKDSQGALIVEVVVNGQIQERPVVTGISDGFQTEIVEGLSEGEVVMIKTRAKP